LMIIPSQRDASRAHNSLNYASHATCLARILSKC
jgi:hypothetical protein